MATSATAQSTSPHLVAEPLTDSSPARQRLPASRSPRSSSPSLSHPIVMPPPKERQAATSTTPSSGPAAKEGPPSQSAYTMNDSVPQGTFLPITSRAESHYSTQHEPDDTASYASPMSSPNIAAPGSHHSATAAPSPTTGFTSFQAMEDYLQGQIPFLDVAVSGKDLFADSKYVVEHLFGWQEHELELDQCKDGITNKLVKAKWVPQPHRAHSSRSLSPNGSETVHAPGMAVLIRVYGKNSEVLIDRKTELMNMLGLSRLGLAPVIHGRFQNGFVYGYVPGDVFNVDDMAHPTKSILVAHKLATWHRVQLPYDRTPKLFPTLERWLKNIPDRYTKEADQELFVKHFDVAKMRNEIALLSDKLTALQSPVTLCHNDLLSANIIYHTETEDVTFIDYEYGSYNYRGFDIANHFCEWAGFTCEWQRVPDRQRMRSWLAAYWQTYTLSAPTEQELDTFTIEVSKFMLAAHFYWGVWALIQASLSDIDFDYMGYALLRFTEYWKRRDEMLAL